MISSCLLCLTSASFFAIPNTFANNRHMPTSFVSSNDFTRLTTVSSRHPLDLFCLRWFCVDTHTVTHTQNTIKNNNNYNYGNKKKRKKKKKNNNTSTTRIHTLGQTIVPQQKRSWDQGTHKWFSLFVQISSSRKRKPDSLSLVCVRVFPRAFVRPLFALGQGGQKVIEGQYTRCIS